MLAKRRGLYKGQTEVIRTPLLLPSFSSKGFPFIQNILEAAEEIIDGEILISAYDLSHGKIKGPFDFAQAVFLDSGGYEASQDVELSDVRNSQYEPEEWTIDKYAAILATWNCSRPTVMVSFDHPDERVPTLEQIERADRVLPKGENIFREILFKPEDKEQEETNIQAIIANIHRLAVFDVVGITEKEIGRTVQKRMIAIACIRKALNAAGLDTLPIHVFGSLDTISTPLYLVAGADIFDGLTWLRFAYHDGMTIYQENFSAIRHGTDVKTKLVPALCFSSNYHYMKMMRQEMQGYIRNGSFDSFKYHRDLIDGAFHAMMEEMEV